MPRTPHRTTEFLEDEIAWTVDYGHPVSDHEYLFTIRTVALLRHVFTKASKLQPLYEVSVWAGDLGTYARVGIFWTEKEARRWYARALEETQSGSLAFFEPGWVPAGVQIPDPRDPADARTAGRPSRAKARR